MIDPVVAEITVPRTPTEAFVGFTAQMGEWWDPMLTPEPATFTGISIDPNGPGSGTISSLTLSPTTVTGGSPSTGTVQLSAPAGGQRR